MNDSLRVLIVEDEALLAMELEALVEDAGHSIAGWATSSEEALRMVELVRDFHLALIGKSIDQGESNDPVTPPTTVGKTLVIEAQNHLQSFYVVDFFVKNQSFEFENINGIVNFLGPKGGLPEPLRQAEVNRILGKMDEMADSGRRLAA